MKQLPLLPKKKFAKRKTARAIAIWRGQNHVILKASLPILRRHREIILKTIRETQDKFEIRLRAMAVMPDHVHLVVRASSREQFANALRMLAGTIARKILKKGKLWRERAWSRVVTPGRDLDTVTLYVANNPLKAGIETLADGFWLLRGILQLEEPRIV